jgi:hypothetical protein
MGFDTQEATVADIDETMRHIQNMLIETETSQSRRNILLESLDDLLEARFEITKIEEDTLESETGATNGKKMTASQEI